MGIKRLPLKNTWNTRELGGYVNKYGKVTNYKSFLRSDDLANLDSEDIDTLYNYGVRTVIDLRGAEELAETGHPIRDLPDGKIDFYHKPVYLSDSEAIYATLEKDASTSFLEEYYLDILKEKSALTAVLRTILNAREGGVLFHCYVGKDRTGIVAMILLGLCEVEELDIVANYEVSHSHIKQSEKIRLEIEASTSNEYYSDARYIERALKYVYENYGTIKEYVRAIGFSDEEIEMITNRLVNENSLAF